MIIRAGRNIYPAEIESAVGDVDGVRKGCVAVFGTPDPRSGSERLIVLAETRETDAGKKDAIRDRIVAVCADLLDAPPDDVVLGPPQTVPKTSSGKIRRSSSRELYESGRIGAKPRAVWRQVAGLAMTSLWTKFGQMSRLCGEYVYAGYWWFCIVLTAVVVWPGVLVLPARSLRWTLLRRAARLFFAATGNRLTIEGDGQIPAGIVVANHASYIDGLMLAAAVPVPLRFVAKKELQAQFVAGLFLRNLGAVFAERFDTGKAVDSKQRAEEAAQSGDTLMFFPEGTLTRRPGLMEFRLGAFVVAAETGVPVIPVTLRGSRSVLRGEQWFPRHGNLHVTISPPIFPRGSDWAAAVHLRDSARAEILYHCGEPDLTEEKILF
jgi:1-acyl-sn-glycerol-3-phosphate acyltransferase